jgi:hypothetical protein
MKRRVDIKIKEEFESREVIESTNSFHNSNIFIFQA